VLEAAPLPDQAAARKRQLLDDAADDLTASTPSDAGQIPRHRLVAGHECGVVRCDDEFVQVTAAAACGRDASQLAIRGVDNDPFAVAETVHDLALPPCQHRLPAEHSDLEVGHGLVRDGTEPDELAGVVEDHCTALARARGRREEHEPGGRAARGPDHRHRRRLQVGARDEPLDVLARCCQRVLSETGEHVASCGSREEEAGSPGQQIPTCEGLQTREAYATRVRFSPASTTDIAQTGWSRRHDPAGRTRGVCDDGYLPSKITRFQRRPPSAVWKKALSCGPRRATTNALLGSAALTLTTAHHRVGRPRAAVVSHVCPPSVVTCTTGRVPPETIHQTCSSTTLAGHDNV